MSTLDIEQEAGTFRMTPEEKEEIDQADAEAEEEARTGKAVPWKDFLAELRSA